MKKINITIIEYKNKIKKIFIISFLCILTAIGLVSCYSTSAITSDIEVSSPSFSVVKHESSFGVLENSEKADSFVRSKPTRLCVSNFSNEKTKEYVKITQSSPKSDEWGNWTRDKSEDYLEASFLAYKAGGHSLEIEMTNLKVDKTGVQIGLSGLFGISFGTMLSSIEIIVNVGDSTDLITYSTARFSYKGSIWDINAPKMTSFKMSRTQLSDLLNIQNLKEIRIRIVTYSGNVYGSIISGQTLKSLKDLFNNINSYI